MGEGFTGTLSVDTAVTERSPCIERQQPAGSGSQDDDDAEGCSCAGPWCMDDPVDASRSSFACKSL